MAEGITRTFYRCDTDTKFWWHWRPKCLTLKQRAWMKKHGKVFTVELLAHARPTTFSLCPACEAEDHRIKTGDCSVYVKRCTTPTFIAASTVPAVQRYYYNNPIIQVAVRRDDPVV